VQEAYEGVEQADIQEALKHKSIGPRDSSSEEDPDNIKVEIRETKELALETQKHYNEVVASRYELLLNLLAGKPQSQWDRIVREMHEHDSWAGVDGKRHDEKRPRTRTSFQECIKLHKLTVFTHNAAKAEMLHPDDST
jgi:hypothetical protein